MADKSSVRPGGQNFGGEEDKNTEDAMDPLNLIWAGESVKRIKKVCGIIKTEQHSILSNKVKPYCHFYSCKEANQQLPCQP